MPLYKFRIDYDGVTSQDDVGEVFATLADAVAHAAVVANELSHNTRPIAVSVVDETGTIVAEGRDPAIG
jgi:hypothetical protein